MPRRFQRFVWPRYGCEERVCKIAPPSGPGNLLYQWLYPNTSLTSTQRHVSATSQPTGPRASYEDCMEPTIFHPQSHPFRNPRKVPLSTACCLPLPSARLSKMAAFFPGEPDAPPPHPTSAPETTCQLYRQFQMQAHSGQLNLAMLVSEDELLFSEHVDSFGQIRKSV